MKIVNKRNPMKVSFKDIEIGECFIDFDEDLNIKLDMSYYETDAECLPNAVVLDSGQPYRFDDDDMVTKVKASVTLD